MHRAEDDDADKLQEISRMDDIYSRSTLSLSATDAMCGSDGLEWTRNVLAINPCSITVKGPHEENVTVVAASNKTSIASDEGPLSKRGMVFQERTLARRIVHFTKGQVFWECHGLEASEVLQRGGDGQSQRQTDVMAPRRVLVLVSNPAPPLGPQALEKLRQASV